MKRVCPSNPFDLRLPNVTSGSDRGYLVKQQNISGTKLESHMGQKNIEHFFSAPVRMRYVLTQNVFKTYL